MSLILSVNGSWSSRTSSTKSTSFVDFHKVEILGDKLYFSSRQASSLSVSMRSEASVVRNLRCSMTCADFHPSSAVPGCGDSAYQFTHHVLTALLVSPCV